MLRVTQKSNTPGNVGGFYRLQPAIPLDPSVVQQQEMQVFTFYVIEFI